MATAPSPLSLSLSALFGGRRTWHDATRHALTHVVDGIKRLQTATLSGFHSRWVHTSVGPVHFLEAGRSAPATTSWVLIHGFASQAVDWAPLLRRLQRRCAHIIAVDLPGHGRSPQPQEAMDEATMLAALEECVHKALGAAKRSVVVGSSTGGMAAIRLAQSAEAKRISHLILISPLGCPMSAVEVDTIVNLFRIDNFTEAKSFVDQLFANRAPWRDVSAWGAWVHLSRPHLNAFLQQLKVCKFFSADELNKMPPALLIWGGSDRILPMAGRDFFANALPNAQLVARDDFTHAPYLERSDEVIEAIDTWAKKYPRVWK